jgi:hypothetical protein
VDVSSSQVAGNVDRRQMEELPLGGRNWMELAMQVKGITSNAVDTNPVRDRQFQLNLDGRKSRSRWLAAASPAALQPRGDRRVRSSPTCSTSRGRSLGIRVQAISRSGTNNLDGSVYGYFRDDKLNSKDFVANRVLPYSNQQLGAAVGGPIVKDKVHYFLSYERENEPNTIITTPNALPGFTWTFPTKLVQNSFLGRADWQMAARDHLTTRVSYWDWDNPFTQVAGTEHPSQVAKRSRRAFNVANTWSRVLSDTTVQELKVGFSHFDWKNQLAEDKLADTPNYVFPTITIGQRRNYPQEFYQNTFSFRYDLTTSRGKHDLKAGVEFLRWKDTGSWELLSRGEFIFSSTPADWRGASRSTRGTTLTRWDLTGLDATVSRFDQNFGDWTIEIPRPTVAIWIGDTWKLSNSFSLNGGVRWDVTSAPSTHRSSIRRSRSIRAPATCRTPCSSRQKLYPGGLRDQQHRAGGFTLERRRQRQSGHPGRQRSLLQHSRLEHHVQPAVVQQRPHLTNSFPNDGRRVHRRPTRGVTADAILSGRATPGAGAACHRARLQDALHVAELDRLPDPVRRADRVRSRFHALERRELRPAARSEPAVQPGHRLQLQPGLGRPDPRFGEIQWLESGKADFAAISSGLTSATRTTGRRASATLVLFQNDNTTNFQYRANNPFDPDADWGRSTEFQRHTLRLNAIYWLPFDINVSGAYLFGSGNYYQTTFGANPFGPVSSANR